MKHEYFIPETDKEEIWKDIEGFEGAYQVSSYGRILSTKKPGITSEGLHGFLCGLSVNAKNYLQVNLRLNGFGKTRKIHRFVVETFIPNPENLPTVNHIDGNKRNNFVDNLEWASYQRNMDHAIDNELINQRGKNHSRVKLTVDQVIAIRDLYSKEDLNYSEMSKIFDINHKAISRIIRGIGWTDITKGISIEDESRHTQNFPEGYSRWHFQRAKTKEFLQAKYLNK